MTLKALGFKTFIQYNVIRAIAQPLILLIQLQNRAIIVILYTAAKGSSLGVEKRHTYPGQHRKVTYYSFHLFNVVSYSHFITSFLIILQKGRKCNISGRYFIEYLPLKMYYYVEVIK